MLEIAVQHQPDQKRFICLVDGFTCVAEYTESDSDRSWNVVHTWVAEELRGRGIAEKLMKALAAEARASGHSLTASCSYAALFLERHKEYADIMKN